MAQPHSSRHSLSRHHEPRTAPSRRNMRCTGHPSQTVPHEQGDRKHTPVKHFGGRALVLMSATVTSAASAPSVAGGEGPDNTCPRGTARWRVLCRRMHVCAGGPKQAVGPGLMSRWPDSAFPHHQNASKQFSSPGLLSEEKRAGMAALSYWAAPSPTTTNGAQ
jgi:hypothetical protein